jgi:AcrR family transcriptional regulator
MRVSAQTKAATRERILQAALALFADKGFGATTTRDIAEAAGIASGTLFNYFQTKETIVTSLASDATSDALAKSSYGEGDSLEEDLFAVIASILRKLKPLRKLLPALMETALSPLAVSRDDECSFRVTHLEAVAALAVKNGRGPLSPTALQLYWTLYTGVLIFWANDTSPKQEETLALIDGSMNMFVGWLCGGSGADPAASKQ